MYIYNYIYNYNNYNNYIYKYTYTHIYIFVYNFMYTLQTTYSAWVPLNSLKLLLRKHFVVYFLVDKLNRSAS